MAVAAAASWPVSSRAHAGSSPARRVGVLYFGSQQATRGADREQAFLRGMRELGYRATENLRIESRYANGDLERLKRMVDELLDVGVEVIVATSTIACQAAQRRTGRVPIVVTATADPIGDGFAETLARPGKNITGMSTSAGDSIRKHLELLGLLEPRPTRIGVLFNPLDRAHAPQVEALTAGAPSTGSTVVPIAASRAEQFVAAFDKASKSNCHALVILNDGLFFAERQALADLAMSAKMPTSYGFRDGPEAGMLMSYGPNLAGLFYRSASLVDRILRGASPAELPFEQPTTFELVVNRKTARRLDVSFTQALVLRADAVIE